MRPKISMEKQMRFFIFVTLIVAALNVHAGAPEVIKLKDLGSAKTSKKEVLARIFADQNKWSAYLAKIESGQDAWVKTWPEMRKVADGGASEQLDIAMYKLVGVKATAVLKIIQKNWKTQAEAQEITKKVCGKAGEEIQENSSLTSVQERANVLSGIQLRQKKINEVTDKGLSNLKANCLLSLQASESFWSKKE
ncbi:hypothetical protein CIK05_06670 [Bdellovibrio sp. qaytius]|nr:hypothetical protein CIK05_06670 [Bdellovibrio sp. qaytius]